MQKNPTIILVEGLAEVAVAVGSTRPVKGNDCWQVKKE